MQQTAISIMEKNTEEKHQKMQEALAKISSGKSIRSVAKEFGIPRSTLYDKLNGRSSQKSILKTELTY